MKYYNKRKITQHSSHSIHILHTPKRWGTSHITNITQDGLKIWAKKPTKKSVINWKKTTYFNRTENYVVTEIPAKHDGNYSNEQIPNLTPRNRKVVQTIFAHNKSTQFIPDLSLWFLHIITITFFLSCASRAKEICLSIYLCYTIYPILWSQSCNFSPSLTFDLTLVLRDDLFILFKLGRRMRHFPAVLRVAERGVAKWIIL